MNKPANASFLSELMYDVRVVWACMLNDARIAIRTPSSISFVVRWKNDA